MPLIPFKKKSTPTRQVQGVISETTGAIPTPKTLAELGSSQGMRIFDPIPELGSPTLAARQYRKMSRGDASVRTSLRAGKAPVLGADYYIDPCDDSEEAKTTAEFVRYNLFEGLTTPFKQFLEQALKMYEDGWAPFELVWELREWGANVPNAKRRKYTMLRKFAPRPPSSIQRILYDNNGGPAGLEHNALRSDGTLESIELPIDKLVIFTFDKDAGDIRGESILRSAYQHWYYKDYLYKIDAIQKERHGIGIPDIELQPGFSKADKVLAHEIAGNLRTNEKAYIVRTPMLKIGFAELSGNLVNALESAQHHDDMIMKNIMVQFLNMGLSMSGGGGRATGATSMDMFLKAMRYIAQSIICDSINMYVIPQLVAYNFKTDRFPSLKVRNIGETKDMQMWAAAMANLLKQNAIQIDDETEQWVRQQMDMPKRTTPYTEKSTSNNGKGGAGDNPTTGYVGKSASSGAV